MMDEHRFGHGSRFNRPPSERRARLRAHEKPKLTAILYGTYYVVYSWPPPTPGRLVLGEPRQMTLGGTTSFVCSCEPEVADRLQPIKVQYLEQTSVHACELVNCESQVMEGINRTMCHCRQSPIGNKIVVLPINDDFLLFYERQPFLVYTEDFPFTCLLLAKYLPSEVDIHAVIEGLDIAKKPGGFTFRPRNEE